MEPSTVSEAQQWRRCSLAALCVLLLAIAGEQVLSAMDPVPAQPRKRCTYSFPYGQQAKAFRLLNDFVSLPAP
jgi:hypothetical protein